MVNGYRPETLTQALQIRQDKEVVPYAGGTDWMIVRDETKPLLFLNNIPLLKEIEADDHNIYIGACCTFTQLLNSEQIPIVLKEAIKGIASPAIRNAGTIGGNVCNSSPAGDTLPILYAMDAELVISTVDSTKVIGIEEFITGPKKNILQKEELLEQIILPKIEDYTYYYKKIGARKAQAISKLSFVGLIRLLDGRIKNMSVAFGAVGPTVIRNKVAETLLTGKSLEEAKEVKNEILKRYEDSICPIDDQRSTAVYRKKAAMNLVKDFLDINGI